MLCVSFALVIAKYTINKFTFTYLWTCRGDNQSQAEAKAKRSEDQVVAGSASASGVVTITMTASPSVWLTDWLSEKVDWQHCRQKLHSGISGSGISNLESPISSLNRWPSGRPLLSPRRESGSVLVSSVFSSNLRQAALTDWWPDWWLGDQSSAIRRDKLIYV